MVGIVLFLDDGSTLPVLLFIRLLEAWGWSAFRIYLHQTIWVACFRRSPRDVFESGTNTAKAC
jgi:hypothetical protein